MKYIFQLFNVCNSLSHLSKDMSKIPKRIQSFKNTMRFSFLFSAYMIGKEGDRVKYIFFHYGSRMYWLENTSSYENQRFLQRILNKFEISKVWNLIKSKFFLPWRWVCSNYIQFMFLMFVFVQLIKFYTILRN